jgi:hypothetical protein
MAFDNITSLTHFRNLLFRLGKKTGTDSKYFASTNRKGENQELQVELRSPQRDRKRDAVKKESSEKSPLFSGVSLSSCVN